MNKLQFVENWPKMFSSAMSIGIGGWHLLKSCDQPQFFFTLDWPGYSGTCYQCYKCISRNVHNLFVPKLQTNCRKHKACNIMVLQYSSQVTSRVHALRGMQACEKLARAQGALEELRAKPKPLESWTIANLPVKLLLRVLAQSWYSPYIKFTSQNIVTCSYNISIPYTERDCYAGASSRKSSHL